MDRTSDEPGMGEPGLDRRDDAAASSQSVVFISHETSDHGLAREIRKYLESAGYSCWMAPDDIRGPLPWPEQVERAIDTCDAMLVVISARASKSGHVSREVDLAIEKTKPLIPVRVEDVVPTGALNYLLRLTQWIDLFPGSVADHASALRAMVDSALAERGIAPPPPAETPPPRRPRPALSRRAVIAVTATVLSILVLATAGNVWYHQLTREAALDGSTQPEETASPDAQPEQTVSPQVDTSVEDSPLPVPPPSERGTEVTLIAQIAGDPNVPPYGDTLKGWGFAADTTLTFTVGGDPVADPPGTDATGAFAYNYRYDTGLDLVAGDVVAVSDATVSKSLTVVAATFDTLDADTDTASGTADPPAGTGAAVNLMWPLSGEHVETVETNVTAGTWRVEFGSDVLPGMAADVCFFPPAGGQTCVGFGGGTT